MRTIQLLTLWIRKTKNIYTNFFFLTWISSQLLVTTLYAKDSSLLIYADYLFNKGEYYRAISEYQRYLFFDADCITDSIYAITQITKCLYFGKDYESVISYVKQIISDNPKEKVLIENLNRYAGLSYLKLGYPKSAITFFEQNVNEPKSELLIGFSYLCLYEWDLAQKKFESLIHHKDSEISTIAKELTSIAKRGANFSEKKPVIAGILSAFIPGSGYVYTGYYQTAFSSFILNLLLLGSSYELQKNGLRFTGITTFLVSFGWYLGNIYGSITSAIRYNNLNKKKFVDESLKIYMRFVEK